MRQRIATLSLVFTAVMLCAGALFYIWLLRYPLNIDELSPRIIAAIQTQLPGLRVDFGAISIQKDPLRNLITLKARNVLLEYPPDIAAQARIESLEVGLDQWAMLEGNVDIVRVTLSGVHGTIKLPAPFIRELLTQDPQKPDRFTWPENLKRVNISNADFTMIYEDEGIQKPYQLHLETMLIRQGKLLDNTLRSTARFVLKDTQSSMAALLTTTLEGDEHWSARLVLNSPNFAHLANFLPLPAITQKQLPQIAAPVRITADISARPSITANIDLITTQGRIAFKSMYEKPLLLTNLSAALSWSEATNIIEIKSVSAKLEDAKFNARGIVSLGHNGKMDVQAAVDALTMPQLVQLWPINAAPNARSWTRDNIVEGEIKNGRATLSGTLEHPVVNFQFGFEDLLVHYRRPMPPLVKASGVGVLTNNGLKLTLSQGQINELQAQTAVVRIEPFNRRPTNALIELPLKGALPKLLAVLDSPPLGFISRYGVNPTQLTGFTQGAVSLKIPLIKNLALDDIDFSGNVRVRQAYIPDIYAGRPLNNADLDIRITPQGLRALGQAKLGMVTLNSLEWIEAFKGNVKTPTIYKMSAQPSIQALSDLDIDLSTIASGTLGVSLQLFGRGGAIERGAFTADLRNTHLSLPLLNTIKALGVPAQASSQITITKQQVRLPNIRLKAPELALDAQMSIPLDEKAGNNRLEIERAEIGSLSASGALEYKEGAPTYLTLAADSFNLAPYLQAYLKPGQGKDTSQDPSQTIGSINTQSTNEQPVHLYARIGSIGLLNNVTYELASLDMVTLGTKLQSFKIDGQLSKGDETSVSFTREGQASRLSANSNNAAQLLKGLDLFNNAKGGSLSIQAQTQEGPQKLGFAGKATMRNFRVLNTPRLAQILTIASLTGLADSLAGRGIEFEDITVPFTLQKGIITLGKSSAIGPAMGITVEGQIDQRTNQTALRGVIIPSYTLNTIVGKIPLLGRVLVGGKKQGIIGFNYRVEGSLTAPKISVNPASGLAPGFLRRLFQSSAPKLPEQSDKPEQSEQSEKAEHASNP